MAPSSKRSPAHNDSPHILQSPISDYEEIHRYLVRVSTGHTPRRVIANIVLGQAGATTLNGSSRGLSSGSDRERFHQLRSTCDAIMIGGATATHEPYANTPKPLIVVSHMKVLPGTAAKNPDAFLSNLSIAASLNKFGVLYATILIEGGPNFLQTAIAEKLIDELYVTRTPTVGHPPFFDDSLLESLRLVESGAEITEQYERYERL